MEEILKELIEELRGFRKEVIYELQGFRRDIKDHQAERERIQRAAQEKYAVHAERAASLISNIENLIPGFSKKSGG